MTQVKFTFEDLEVWQKAIEFAQAVLDLADRINSYRNHFKLIEQLESSSTSIALNIAEGEGRYSKKEFIRFLYVARGSLYETITLLIILKRYNCINDQELVAMKNSSDEIGKMISGLITFLKLSLLRTKNHEL